MMVPEQSTSELYRLEHTATGERLLPVQRIDEATHASIGVLRRVMQAHAREVVGLRAETELLRRRLQERDAELGQQREAVIRAHDAVRRLMAKNAALIGEKRRLRDALIGKKPLKTMSYRVDVDRHGVARESIMEVLDTFPHKERVREALAEAHRLAERKNASVRSLRLDTAWQAVLQRVIED